jgi:hypothetical protein
VGPTLLTQHRSPITDPPGLRPEGQMTVLRNIKQLTLLFQRSGRIHYRRIAPAMNILSRAKQIEIISRAKQIEIIAALCEGVGQRAVARLADVDRKTVARLALQVGKGCAELHDRRVVGVRTGRLELDELWAFVGKKQKRTRAHETEKGDQYTYVALASTSRAIVTYRTGKRDGSTTDDFIQDLRQRVPGSSCSPHCGAGRSGRDQHELCRAQQSFAAHGVASLHAADKRLFQEA